MVNDIDARLQQISLENRPALMAHAVVGYPDMTTTKKLVIAMEDAGVDMVELQIPFSDPLADGPTIQQACELALDNGTRVADAFAAAAEISGTTTIPLLFMTYYNIVYNYGVEKFCKDAAKAGVSGVIVPDTARESAEHEGLLAACERYNLCNIVTLAPTSTPERIAKNAAIAQGFIYCMSRQGVTGTAQGFDDEIESYLERVRKRTSVPLAVGFGVSSVERLRVVAPYADIVVVGSAIINELSAHGLGAATSFVGKMAREVREVKLTDV